jgi:hypothetical protein
LAGNLRSDCWKAQLNPTQINRTLSAEGNPELTSISAILWAMGMRLAVERVKAACCQPQMEPVAERAPVRFPNRWKPVLHGARSTEYADCMNVGLNVAYLTPLENAVIEAILQGKPQSEQCLREQLRHSELRSREFNGYGFFTNLAISEHAPRRPNLGRTLLASALVDDQLCGFILWITDGKIDFLEGYPLGRDSWPENESFRAITLNKVLAK